MIFGLRWIGLTGLVMAALVTAARAYSQPEPDETVPAVRGLLDRQVADWNKGDLDGFAGGYWNSPKLVFQSGGQRHDGFEVMRARYRRRYQAEGKAMGHLVFSAVEVEPLGPAVALVRGGWRLTMPDGSRPGGLFTLIVRKFPEGWKIIHDHTSSEEPPAPKPATPKEPNP